MAKTRFRNIAEQQLYEKLTGLGFDVTKRGWPDFACFKNGHVILVEVKPDSQHPLKREQSRLMTALAERGVDCFRFSPDGGLERILSNKSVQNVTRYTPLQAVTPVTSALHAKNLSDRGMQKISFKM